MQYGRIGLRTCLQQQFHVKNVQRSRLWDYCALFSVLRLYFADQLRRNGLGRTNTFHSDRKLSCELFFADPYEIKKYKNAKRTKKEVRDTAVIPEQFDQYVRYRPGCFYYVRASGRDPQSVHGLEHFLCFMIKKMIRIKRDYRWQVIQKIRKNIRQRIS